jgi:fatty acid desaturase
MNANGTNRLLKRNTFLWLAAMLLPAFLSIAFSSAKFFWPVILPLLLLGPMLASNKMIAQAAAKPPVTPEVK